MGFHNHRVLITENGGTASINPSYTILREDLLRYIPKNSKRVLDVGCSIGTLGKALKEMGVQEVVGIEIDPTAASIASRWLDKVITGSADNIDLSEYSFPKKYFDCIVYGDILEHCIDPWTIVRDHKRYLSDKGVIIVSIPNIRHFTVIFNLLLGDFPYRERGIQDKTHLRWFTKKTLIQMFKENGYDVRILQRNYRLCDKNINTHFAKLANSVAKYVANIFYPFREFFVFQYILECRPMGRMVESC